MPQWMALEDFMNLPLTEQFDYNPVWATIVLRWRRATEEGIESDLDFPCPICDGEDEECLCQMNSLT
jgi:hypothetical protein